MRLRMLSGVRTVILATVLSATGCAASPTTPAPAPTPVLTPARTIAGIWTTKSAPAPFILQSDLCNGNRQDIGRLNLEVKWTITAVAGFTNVVDIEMRHTQGPSIDYKTCGGWVPLVSPQFFRLCISGDTLSRCSDGTYRGGYAFGSFTAVSMTLTWTHWECLIYCWGEVTERNKLELFPS